MQTIQKQLENFDTNTLDYFERQVFDRIIKHSTKVEALQCVINSVDGDFSQLNEELAEIATLQAEQSPKNIMICDNGLDVQYEIGTLGFNSKIYQDHKGNAYFKWNDNGKKTICWLDAITENN